VVRVEIDEDFGAPVAKLSGSNHYLFKKGIIGSTSMSLFSSYQYDFDYFNPKETLPPTLIKYSDNTKKYNYLRSNRLGAIYVILLYCLYYLMTINSIDLTIIPNWSWLDKHIASRFIYGLIIFGLLIGGPNFLFEFNTDLQERNEKIIIQQKHAPFPFEYKTRHYNKLSYQLIEELGYIARISIILMILTYRTTGYGHQSLATGTQDLVIVFLILAFMWVLIKVYISKNIMIDFFNKYSNTKSLDIDNFFTLLEKEIQEELSQDNTPIEDLIGMGPGENETLEFKASYWTETKGENEGQRDRCLEDAIVKEVAAFLNTNGGVLLVGVADDSPFYPTNTLEKDLGHSSSVKTVGDLELHISQILENNLICKDSLNGFWRIRFPVYRGVQIIRIDVDKGPRHVLAHQTHEQKKKNADKNRQFHFWRQNSRSNEPSLETWMDHVRDHWSD